MWFDTHQTDWYLVWLVAVIITPYNLALSVLLTAGHDTDGRRKKMAFKYNGARIILCNIYKRGEFWSGVFIIVGKY